MKDKKPKDKPVHPERPEKPGDEPQSQGDEGGVPEDPGKSGEPHP